MRVTPMSLSKLMFVIRCRECKHFCRSNVLFKGTEYWCDHPHNRGISVEKNDYCSRAEESRTPGERRVDNEDDG